MQLEFLLNGVSYLQIRRKGTTNSQYTQIKFAIFNKKILKVRHEINP